MCWPVSLERNSAAQARRLIVSSRSRRSSLSELSSCVIVSRSAAVRSSTVCSRRLRCSRFSISSVRRRNAFATLIASSFGLKGFSMYP